jgi:nucleotide-binding universal stress UspA family protein
MSITRLIVATDLTPASDAVVEKAGEIAAQLGAELVATYVLTNDRLIKLRESLPPEASYDDAVHERLESDIEAQLARCADGGTPSRSRVLVGHEADALHHFAAEESADIVVIGIHNRSRVGKLLLGSTAQEILLGSPCPVLGVPVDEI